MITRQWEVKQSRVDSEEVSDLQDVCRTAPSSFSYKFKTLQLHDSYLCEVLVFRPIKG
jgi:hypothetical protein